MLAFLGMPLIIWGALCLLVAAVYTIVYPRSKIEGQRVRPLWRFLILRWFHALVWVLLASSCFIWAEYLPGGDALAKALALLALLLYLVFIFTLALHRRTGH
jgi:hypothetical protein